MKPMTMIALLLAWPSVAGPQAPSDEHALAALVDRWAIARSANDAEAMRPLFDANVDHIRLTNGEVIAADQAGVLRWFDAAFKGDGKGSTVRIDSSRVRTLSATAGVADFAFTLRGADGRVLTGGHTTFVAIKRGDTWTVSAIRFAPSAAK